MENGEVAQCRALLRRLIDLGKKVSIADPELRQLRERFRDTSAKALQVEYELAQVRYLLHFICCPRMITPLAVQMCTFVK